jgi:hypothetical protein
MSDYDRHNLDNRRTYLREYMRRWRKKNAEKQREIARRQNEKYRLSQLACVCDGDGFEFDDTNLLRETPRQSRMWAELLAGAK